MKKSAKLRSATAHDPIPAAKSNEPTDISALFKKVRSLKSKPHGDLVIPWEEWALHHVPLEYIPAVCAWEFGRTAFVMPKAAYDERIMASFRDHGIPEWIDTYPTDLDQVQGSPLGAEALKFFFETETKAALTDEQSLDQACEFYEVFCGEVPPSVQTHTLPSFFEVRDAIYQGGGFAGLTGGKHLVPLEPLYLNLYDQDRKIMAQFGALLAKARVYAGIPSPKRQPVLIGPKGVPFPASYESALKWLAVFRLGRVGVKPSELHLVNNPYGITVCDEKEYYTQIKDVAIIIEWYRTGEESLLNDLSSRKERCKRQERKRKGRG